MVKRPRHKPKLGATIYNDITGEPLGDTLVLLPPRREKIEGSFLMLFFDGLESLAKDKDLKGETIRVLLYALSCLEYKNTIPISQVEIAEELGIKRQAVNRAFKLLEAKGIIEEVNRRHRQKIYVLNDRFGWRGTGKALKEYRKEKIIAEKEQQSLNQDQEPSNKEHAA